MSKRADLLIACMLGNRWNASVQTVGASCAAASPVPRDATSRIHLETLLVSVKNDAVGAGTLHTVQLQIRGSLGNTVLAGYDFLVGSTSVAQVNQSNLAFAAKKLGTGLIAAMNTAAGSVSYCINIAGWIEDTNG